MPENILNPPMALHMPQSFRSPTYKVAITAVTLSFLVAYVGLLGILLDIPVLYNWDLRGITFGSKTITCLLLLSIGYLVSLFSPSTSSPHRGLRYFAMACYGMAFLIGFKEVVSYMVADKSLTLEEFLVPYSPVQGHMSLYSALGVQLAAFSSVVSLFMAKERPWTHWAMQIGGVLLINLALFGFIENIGKTPLFHLFISIPASIGLLCYGVALLFYPVHTLHLAYAFFSNPQTRWYTFLFCCAWLGLVAWQSILGILYLNPYDLTVKTVSTILVLDDLIEILISSAILGLGLHILGTMSKTVALTKAVEESSQKLQSAFDSFAILAATLSHDLKAPIQTQIDAIEMVKAGHFGDDIASERNQRMLSSILDNNRFELDLVQNLVELLRYDVKEEHYHPTALSLTDILAEVKREFEPLALRKEQKLLVDHYQIDLRLDADYAGLRRVLNNLISNAVLHAGPQATIHVSASRQAQAWQFTVEDDGPGVPVEKRPTLFERFSNKSSSKSPLGSSGLGLYIARRIVNRHGGEIWLESPPGKGAAFHFTIPQPPRE